MSDQFEDFRERKRSAKREKEASRELANQQYMAARELATDYGMELVRHSEVHYALIHPAGWRKEIYPGNRRIWAPDRIGPYLKLPDEWTLVDVVNASIEALEKLKEGKT